MTQNNIGNARILLLHHLFEPVFIPHKHRGCIFPAKISSDLPFFYGKTMSQMIITHHENTFFGHKPRKRIVTVNIFRHTVHNL